MFEILVFAYKANPYTVENMEYNAKRDEYTCPNGRKLKFRRESKKTTENGYTNLDADQIYFVNQIIEYIVRNGVMKDMSVLQEAPFTDRGSIVEVFTDISVWLGIRSVIDKINANAAA